MDEKAKKILLKAYWGSQGWKNGSTSPEDFEYAKSRGLMFDPVKYDHAKLVRAAIEQRDAIKPKKIGRGFVASLSTGDVHLRSAIGSYGNIRDLTPHRFRKRTDDLDYLCVVCDGSKSPGLSDLNVLNFERIKWGGVRHNSLIYNIFDLGRFAVEFKTKPSQQDQVILRKLLQFIRTADAKTSYGKLKKTIKELLPNTNLQQADATAEILMYSGLIDFGWKGSCGLNEDMVKFYFGSLPR